MTTTTTGPPPLRFCPWGLCAHRFLASGETYESARCGCSCHRDAEKERRSGCAGGSGGGAFDYDRALLPESQPPNARRRARAVQASP